MRALRLDATRRRQARRVLLGLVAAALAALFAADAWRLARALAYNRAIDEAAGAAASDRAIALAADADAATAFVQAHAAARAGRGSDALALYQAAGRHAGIALAAQYNLGNLHLREALALHERDELQAQPQAVELAKRHFRAALHIDPGHWPSKYNLERALHLAPETPDDRAPVSGHAADRAVTSLRGFTLGLP